jgi:hypothetical protein
LSCRKKTDNEDKAKRFADQGRKHLLEQMDFVFHPPAIPTRTFEFKDHLTAASKMRQLMDENNKEHCCCVCSRRRRNKEFVKSEGMPPRLDHIPNLELLLADVPKTPQLPRDAKTTFDLEGKTFCLQKFGIHVPEEGIGGPVTANVCQECFNELRLGRVPKASLVSIDTGSYLDIPRQLTGGHELKPLSHIEENILAINRSFRAIYMMRAFKGSNQEGAGQWNMRGHVIAFPNNDINEVVRCFPMSFKEIPEQMQAIFINVLTENQDIPALIKKSPAFRIDGVNLARWARYLAFVYKDLLKGRVDQTVIDQYQALETGQMPQSFVDNSRAARNEDDARALAQSLMGGNDGRHGYANAFNDIGAEEIAHAATRPIEDFASPGNNDAGENITYPYTAKAAFSLSSSHACRTQVTCLE